MNDTAIQLETTIDKLFDFTISAEELVVYRKQFTAIVVEKNIDLSIKEKLLDQFYHYYDDSDEKYSEVSLYIEAEEENYNFSDTNSEDDATRYLAQKVMAQSLMKEILKNPQASISRKIRNDFQKRLNNS